MPITNSEVVAVVTGSWHFSDLERVDVDVQRVRVGSRHHKFLNSSRSESSDGGPRGRSPAACCREGTVVRILVRHAFAKSVPGHLPWPSLEIESPGGRTHNALKVHEVARPLQVGGWQCDGTSPNCLGNDQTEDCYCCRISASIASWGSALGLGHHQDPASGPCCYPIFELRMLTQVLQCKGM